MACGSAAGEKAFRHKRTDCASRIITQGLEQQKAPGDYISPGDASLPDARFHPS
jgi:hypothetical protein